MKRLPREPSEWLMLARVAVLLGAIQIALPRVSLPRLLGYLTPRHRKKFTDPLTVDVRMRFADALLARLPVGTRGNCLPRSLVLYRLAARAGLDVRLHCGVRRGDRGLDGHAWCTAGDTVLAGASAAGFTETFSFSAKA
jgi:Transglutaminase-like superfamily